MWLRLAHRVVRSSQATPAAVDKSQRPSHKNSDIPWAAEFRRIRRSAPLQPRARSVSGSAFMNPFAASAYPSRPLRPAVGFCCFQCPFAGIGPAISLSVYAIAIADSRKVMWIAVCAISTRSL